MAYFDDEKRNSRMGFPNIGGGDVRKDFEPPYTGPPSGATWGDEAYGAPGGSPGIGGTAANWAYWYPGDENVDQSFFELNDITSMQDWYDWYQTEGFGEESFYEWLSGTGPSGGPWGSQDPGPGGAQGGAGDLGTGSSFFGGGAGTEGMWDYDCAQMGPSYNSAGDCITCCDYSELGAEDQSWGEYYGQDTTESQLDPGLFDDACFDQWEAAQGAGFEGSFGDFSDLYCGG